MYWGAENCQVPRDEIVAAEEDQGLKGANPTERREYLSQAESGRWGRKGSPSRRASDSWTAEVTGGPGAPLLEGWRGRRRRHGVVIDGE